MDELAETVLHHDGVASVAALERSAFSAADVTRAVRRGTLLRVRRGWVAIPDASPEVVRAVTVGGCLSCISVLRRREVWAASDHRLHVRLPARLGTTCSPYDRSRPLGNPRRYGVVSHRAVGGAVVVEAVDRLDVALAHAAVCQSVFDAVASFDSALHAGLVTSEGLVEALRAFPARARSLLGLADAASESGLETRARLGLRAVNIATRSQVEIAGVGHVDLLVGDRLVIELDGEKWHSGPKAYTEDRRRDLVLTRLNYRVLRLSYAQVVRQWPRVLETIRQLVAAGEHRWGARTRRPGSI